MPKNVLVAQSGGPSPVINASLQGVIEACSDYPGRIGNIYAPWHGIEGVLLEELLDIGAESEQEIKLLRTTPAAGAIGTCRYKLSDDRREDFDRIIDVMAAHDIGYFFYIGGNDSMDTASKVAALAAGRGIDLVVAGVPKTIDNDVGDPEFELLDHTPGYGSCARYWANIIQNVNEENRGMNVSESVAVIQAMGRATGFITAASRLADPQREMPLQLYMAESKLGLAELYDNVRSELDRSGRVIVVVNEGFDVGDTGAAYDGFGHVEYGASKISAAQAVVNYLNERGLGVRGQATNQVPGVLQRGVSIYASKVDIEEAYQVGRKAVAVAMSEGSGYMATIRRAKEPAYRAYYDRVPLDTVANFARHIPAAWIAKNKIDVTDDFIRYAQPLIAGGWPDIPLENGLQRFARFKRVFANKKLGNYTPVGMR